MAIQPGTQIGPDGRRHPITQPAPAAVVEPQDDADHDADQDTGQDAGQDVDQDADRDEGAGQDPVGQEGTGEGDEVPYYEANVVPSAANDVIEWIENAADADDAAARAYAAREAEQSHKPQRSTVVAAIDKALAPG